jgi:diguanylate cyclase (GGDEF)-like protein
MVARNVRRLVLYVTLCCSRLNRLDVLSLIALLGLAAIMIYSSAVAFESTRTATRALNSAVSAEAVDASLRTARYAVASEESLNRKYRLEPGKGVAAAHRASADSLAGALLAARNLGDATDRAVLDDALRDQNSYLAGTSKMYAAVDRHDARTALALDRTAVDPVFHRIERAVGERAEAHEMLAETAIFHLRETQRRTIAMTISLSALRLLSLGIFVFVLITYQRRLKASYQNAIDELENAALTDHLTHIGNHRAYQVDLQREASRAHRYGETLSLALLDVDDFKVVNDRSGHLYGDTVLAKLAALFSSLRLEDRAYRIGGDEFAIILPHSSIDAATKAMQRLQEEVETSVFDCTVSIGLASLTGSECDLVSLQTQADAAMYAGKRGDRNGVTVFDASVDGMWLLSPERIHSLHRLIAAGSMQVAFQPIWDVHDRRVLAYEALARPDAKYGFGGPQEAFDLADRIGCTRELDAVCRAGALVAARELPDDALLFINLSPQSLDQSRLDVDELVKLLRAAGLTPDRVVIEITERSITRVGTVINSARLLQEHGFRLALDDTGAGNSGLEMLSRLPVDFVKIDREIIVKALDDRNARGVLAGIVAIAETTGAYVIAEGIETTQMLDFVCHLGRRETGAYRGADGVQGYLLRRPSQTFPKPDETLAIAALLAEFAAGEPRSAA